ncbi:MAG: hypothetical protein QW548_00690 [Candidatus Aenigmatarchaeota archaeon]
MEGSNQAAGQNQAGQQEVLPNDDQVYQAINRLGDVLRDAVAQPRQSERKPRKWLTAVLAAGVLGLAGTSYYFYQDSRSAREKVAGLESRIAAKENEPKSTNDAYKILTTEGDDYKICAKHVEEELSTVKSQLQDIERKLDSLNQRHEAVKSENARPKGESEQEVARMVDDYLDHLVANQTIRGYSRNRTIYWRLNTRDDYKTIGTADRAVDLLDGRKLYIELPGGEDLDGERAAFDRAGLNYVSFDSPNTSAEGIKNAIGRALGRYSPLPDKVER